MATGKQVLKVQSSEVHGLKPCPFCGGDVRMAHGFGKHWVVCDVCNFWSKSKHHEADAAAFWNTRAPSERDEFAQILAGLKARGIITQADVERLERDGVSRGDAENAEVQHGG